MNDIIFCHDITRTFKLGKGRIKALDQISLNVQPGKMIGILGPDGAGKTTLLRILAGLMRPDSGKASVLGFDTVQEAAKIQSVVGYMPQKFGLYETLSLVENLKLYADMHQVPQSVQPERFASLLKMMNLSRFPNRPAGKLSGGMKSKLALACSLASEPELLLLDEPTVGVDIISRRELFAMLRDIITKKHTTVMVSTSYMDEADYCDYVIVLHEGKMIASGTRRKSKTKPCLLRQIRQWNRGFRC